jgi:hypothetical protein
MDSAVGILTSFYLPDRRFADVVDAMCRKRL